MQFFCHILSCYCLLCSSVVILYSSFCSLQQALERTCTLSSSATSYLPENTQLWFWGNIYSPLADDCSCLYENITESGVEGKPDGLKFCLRFQNCLSLDEGQCGAALGTRLCSVGVSSSVWSHSELDPICRCSPKLTCQTMRWVRLCRGTTAGWWEAALSAEDNIAVQGEGSSVWLSTLGKKKILFILLVSSYKLSLQVETE